jgi:hypothetical protein
MVIVRMAYVIKKELDIRIPSIGLLSEGSTDITTPPTYP